MMELPSCAIGGITADNCGALVRAGTDFLAVVGCVWNHPDGPAAGVRALNVAIREARREHARTFSDSRRSSRRGAIPDQSFVPMRWKGCSVESVPEWDRQFR